MNIRTMIKILEPFCDKIEDSNGHYKAFVKGSDEMVYFSGSPSDQNWYKQVFRDFRRLGVVINELKKIK